MGAQNGWGTAIGPLAADLDGDGKMEIVVANGPSESNGSAGSITALDPLTGRIVWQDTSANLGFSLNLDGHTPFEIADLDGDGKLETVVSTWNGPLALRSNGALYWRRTDVNSGYNYLTLCDINGDGHPEIFVNRGFGPINGYDYLTCLSFDGQVLYQGWSWSPCWGGLTVGDPSGDGKFMVFQGDRNYKYYGGGPISPDPYKGGGMGIHAYDAFTLKLLWSDPTVGCSSQVPILADVDKDGVLDVIVADQEAQGIVVLNSADGSVVTTGWKYRKGYTGMEAHSTSTVYDLDGDGNLELMGCHDSRPEIWDLYDWTSDGYLSLSGTANLICHEPPKLGRVTADGKMDIIAMNVSGVMYVFQYDPTVPGKYKEISDYTVYGLSGNDFTLVQDLDGDGYNELVVSTWGGYVYCFNTPGPASSQKPRTGLQFYSERRCGVAEYVPPFTPSAPVLRDEQPQDATVNQTSNPRLVIRATSFQNKTVTGTFGSNATGTWLTVGSFSGSNGLYNVSTSDMRAPGHTYYWNVTCSDGSSTTTRVYSFTTWSDPPSQETPRLGSDGSNNLTCYNQTTNDPKSDPVTNIYNWQMDGTSLDTLNLPFDTRTTNNPLVYDNLTADGFENGFASWSGNGGTTWDQDSTQKHSGTYSAHAGTGDQYLTSNSIDTSGAESLTVSFWYRNHAVNGKVYLQFWNGTIYRDILGFPGTGPSDTWRFYSLQTYDVRCLIRDFRVRFSASLTSGDFWIDDFAITAPSRTKDYSGNNNYGTVHGATWTNNGVVGGAYVFDGTTDFIRVPDSPSLGGDGSWSEISVEFWIKPLANQTGAGIVAKRDPTMPDHYASYMVGFQTGGQNNTLYWGLGSTINGWQKTSNSQTVLTAGSWYHVVCTYKSGPGLTIYINGTQRANIALTGNIAPSQGVYLFGAPLFIGTDGSNSRTSGFNGALDELHVYNRALSLEQVLKRYDDTKNGLSGNSTTVSRETKTGGVWNCLITPNDSFGDGQTKLSNSVSTPSAEDIAIVAVEPQRTSIPAGSSVSFDTTVNNHGGYSATWNLGVSIDYVYVPVVRDLTLQVDVVKGWNYSTPGPTISVVQGDLVNLSLQSGDSLYHMFYVDYDNDSFLDSGEPASPFFTFANMTFSFTADTVGNFTYYDAYHQYKMFGLLCVNPQPHQTAQIGSDNIELESNQSATLTVSWNTTGFAMGKYAVTAYASPVPDETDTADNNLTSPITVMVGMPENPAPSVSISPSSWVIEIAQSQLFTSTVSGGTAPYSYQWYLNGTLVSGATSDSWTFKPASAGSLTVYAKIADAVGMQATSNTATVTVNVAVHARNVAITNVTSDKTMVGQNYTLNITATTANLGEYPETFNVTVYANTTIVGTQTVNNLLNGTFTQLSFSWNTTGAGKGNYTISVHAEPVSGETNTGDNNLTSPITVMVGIPGDVVSPFGAVDMRDVSFVARRFMCPLGDPLWDPVADINCDGKIDMKDVSLVALAF